MTLGKTDYLSSKLLNLLFGLEAFTPPAVYYLGLLTNLTAGTEVPINSTNGYARYTMVNDGNVMLPTTTDTKILSNVDIEFDAALEDWGMITHFALYDDSVGGNCFYVGQLDIPADIKQGDILLVRAGNIWVRD